MSSAPVMRGRVQRLNTDVGFGYVATEDGLETYIFVFGKALTHATAATLRVGMPVTFRLVGQGRVQQLTPVPRVHGGGERAAPA